MGDKESIPDKNSRLFKAEEQAVLENSVNDFGQDHKNQLMSLSLLEYAFESGWKARQDYDSYKSKVHLKRPHAH